MFPLYFDEDSTDWQLIKAIRKHNIDAISALEVQMLGQEDNEQLNFATSQNRVLCSFNIRDFNRIHAEWARAGKEHAGIILVRQQQYSIGEYIRRLQNLMEQKSWHDMRNWIEFLSAWG